MTEKINFGKSIVRLGGEAMVQKTGAAKAEKSPAQKDRVQFSSVLQDVNRNRETAGTSDPQRAEKLAALKSQIDSGNYKPDLEKVAQSLVDFMKKQG